MTIIESIPTDKIPILKKAVELENQNHEAITTLLKNLLANNTTTTSSLPG